MLNPPQMTSSMATYQKSFQLCFSKTSSELPLLPSWTVLLTDGWDTNIDCSIVVAGWMPPFLKVQPVIWHDQTGIYKDLASTVSSSDNINSLIGGWLLSSSVCNTVHQPAQTATARQSVHCDHAFTKMNPAHHVEIHQQLNLSHRWGWLLAVLCNYLHKVHVQLCGGGCQFLLVI